VINILGESDKALMKHFAKGFTPEEPAFEGLRVERSADGVPVLPDAMANLECRVRGRREVGDHLLILAEVVGGGLTGEGPPMVHVRRSGANY
jgi:flavin reductase (DIM6/NTAB) family NADH-FMN oxidoreductase RutF